MTSTEIDTAITSYLPLLNELQKEAILTVIKTFVHDLENESYDEEFEDELQRRFADFEKGEVATYTLEETENRARAAYSIKRKK